MSQPALPSQMIFSERKDGRRRHFRRQHDKKVGALALASLIALPADSLPQELKGNVAQLSAGSIKLLSDLQAQKVHIQARSSHWNLFPDDSGLLSPLLREAECNAAREEQHSAQVICFQVPLGSQTNDNPKLERLVCCMLSNSQSYICRLEGFISGSRLL